MSWLIIARTVTSLFKECTDVTEHCRINKQAYIAIDFLELERFSGIYRSGIMGTTQLLAFLIISLLVVSDTHA